MDTNTSEPNCPVLIRSQSAQPIARINPDRTWSVKWPEVLNQAYQPMTHDNVAICAIAKVLIAGRDNFRTSSWDTVQPWTNHQFDIGVCDPIDAYAAMALVGPTNLIAYININGVWSVDWSEVYNIRTLIDSFWGLVPLAGFCELLIGAKDNFHTQPMKYIDRYS